MSTSKKIPPPSTKVLLNAFVLSVKLAKRIDNDFYRDSFNGLIKICKDEDGDRVIYKSEEENTSSIVNSFETDGCYLIETQHTIYILNKDNTQVEE
jgi:hypothetical protein